MKKRTLKRTLVLVLSFLLLLSFVANHSLVFATVGEDAAAAAVPIDAQTNTTQDMTASMTVTNGEMTDETLATQSTNSNYPNRHEYTPGLYDGGVYTLRNYVTGEYLSVQNGATSEFSQLTTTTSFFNQYSRFKFDYLGAGLYRFAPLSSPQYYVTLSWYDSGGTLELYSVYESWGEYKIQYAGDGLYRIYAKVTNFETVLCSGITGKATHNNLNDVAEYYWNNTLWELVPYSLTYNAYEKVEFRHETTGRYLNVWGEYTADGSLVYATKYHATENEQFQMHATDIEGEYYFSPTHRTTTYLAATNNLSISTTQNLSTQSFQLLLVDTDENGYPLYQISAMVNGVRKYLNMGTQVPGRVTEYYAVLGDDESQLWALETVGFDYHDMRTLGINQTYEKELWSVDEKAVYVVKNEEIEKPMQYRILVTASWSDMRIRVYENKNLTLVPYYIEAIDETQYVIGVVFEPGNTYYCPIYNNDHEPVDYQIQILPFVAVYHCYEHYLHDPIYYAVLRADDMGWIYHDRQSITAGGARTSINILGQRDFNSDLFMYTGHGLEGGLSYEGGQEQALFYSYELPNMSNCKLAIWLCCFSARDGVTSDSMLQQSISNGAHCAIGWRTSINSWDAKDFARLLFYQFSLGETISMSIYNALNEYDSYIDIIQIAGNIEIRGDQYVALHPDFEDEFSSPSIEEATILSAFDKSQYTLTVENDSIGVKLYSKLINGITTDDYYIEYYQNGKLINTKKSNYEFSITDEMVLMANSVLATNPDINVENLHYSYIDGEWHLLEKHMTVHEGDTCECQYEVSYYDWTAHVNDNAVVS